MRIAWRPTKRVPVRSVEQMLIVSAECGTNLHFAISYRPDFICDSLQPVADIQRSVISNDF